MNQSVFDTFGLLLEQFLHHFSELIVGVGMLWTCLFYITFWLSFGALLAPLLRANCRGRLIMNQLVFDNFCLTFGALLAPLLRANCRGRPIMNQSVFYEFWCTFGVLLAPLLRANYRGRPIMNQSVFLRLLAYFLNTFGPTSQSKLSG